jgi:hypothetical protein
MMKKPRVDPGQESSDPQPTYIPVKIPEKYKKAETSGLTYEVQRGKQIHDLNLE